MGHYPEFGLHMTIDECCYRKSQLLDMCPAGQHAAISASVRREFPTDVKTLPGEVWGPRVSATARAVATCCASVEPADATYTGAA
jgi:hypothetical protein